VCLLQRPSDKYEPQFSVNLRLTSRLFLCRNTANTETLFTTQIRWAAELQLATVSRAPEPPSCSGPQSSAGPKFAGESCGRTCDETGHFFPPQPAAHEPGREEGRQSTFRVCDLLLCNLSNGVSLSLSSPIDRPKEAAWRSSCSAWGICRRRSSLSTCSRVTFAGCHFCRPRASLNQRTFAHLLNLLARINLCWQSARRLRNGSLFGRLLCASSCASGCASGCTTLAKFAARQKCAQSSQRIEFLP